MPMTIPKFGPMNVVTMMLPGVMNQASFNQIIRVQQGKGNTVHDKLRTLQ